MVVAEQKKGEKDTQNTQNKKKQRMKTDKKNCGNFFTSFWFLTQFDLLYIHLYIVVVVVVVAVIV